MWHTRSKQWVGIEPRTLTSLDRLRQNFFSDLWPPSSRKRLCLTGRRCWPEDQEIIMKGDVAAADAVRPAQIQPPSMGSTGKRTPCFSVSPFCSQFFDRCSCFLEGKTSWAQPQFGDFNSSMVPIFYVMLPLEEVLGKALHFRPRCIHLIMTLQVPRRYAPCEPQASRTLISLIRQKCWTLLVPRQVTAQFNWLQLQEMCHLKYVAAAFLLAFSHQNLKSQIDLSTVVWTVKKKTEKKNDQIGKQSNNN